MMELRANSNINDNNLTLGEGGREGGREGGKERKGEREVKKE